MLSMGNLGGNQRALVGTSQRTGFSFTMLELLPDGKLAVEAVTGSDFEGAIDVKALPRSIGSGDKALVRRDLIPVPEQN